MAAADSGQSALAIEDGAPAVGDSSIGDPIKLDALGPIVLNSDGTMSRISNWGTLSAAEQERTMRLVARRNAQRRKKLDSSSEVGRIAVNSTS